MMNPDQSTLVVCVQNPNTSHSLIRHGKALADANGWNLEVLSVQPRPRRGQPYPIAELEQLHRAARSVGAEMTVYYGDAPAPLAIDFLQSTPTVHVVLGTSPGYTKGFDKGFVRDLRKAMPYMPITMVDAEGIAHTLVPGGHNLLVPAALKG